jgi:predicted aldo/keto reductase-like oxidoreductase
VGTERVELAIRYALGLPGVATLNLGVHTADQLRQNVDFVRRYRPLTPDEINHLERTGKELAGQWGPHFGPVV